MPRNKVRGSKQAKSKARVRYRARNWTITMNNYTTEDCDLLPLLIGEPFGKQDQYEITYIGVAEERGKKKNTPHLQGFMQCNDKGIYGGSKGAVAPFEGWGHSSAVLVLPPTYDPLTQRVSGSWGMQRGRAPFATHVDITGQCGRVVKA